MNTNYALYYSILSLYGCIQLQQWFRIYHDMDHSIHCSIPITYQQRTTYCNTTTAHDQDILDFSSAPHADLILALSAFSNFLVAPLIILSARNSSCSQYCQYTIYKYAMKNNLLRTGSYNTGYEANNHMHYNSIMIQPTYSSSCKSPAITIVLCTASSIIYVNCTSTIINHIDQSMDEPVPLFHYVVDPVTSFIVDRSLWPSPSCVVSQSSFSLPESAVLVCLSSILPTLSSSRTTVLNISASYTQYATLHLFVRAPSMQQCNHAIITLTLLSYFIPASSQYHHVLICPFHPASELGHLGKGSLSVSWIIYSYRTNRAFAVGVHVLLHIHLSYLCTTTSCTMHCIPLPVHHILMWSIPLVSLNHQRSIDMSINLLRDKLRPCTYTMHPVDYNFRLYYILLWFAPHDTGNAHSFNLETKQYYSLGMLQLQPISYSKIICTLPTYVSCKITGNSSISSQQIN